ncbi:hypothetical protein RND81_14G213900 [Saponaria officinalis]|uniref:Pectinesterase inhibitor domain-containing protein n=1 Tax=Saponaria officinalis TaxID=3572 RepID=A0AAW1GPS2_SAPOF
MRQFIIYLLMVSFITSTSAINGIVSDTCMKMMKLNLYYNTPVHFCVTALNSDPRSSNATNIQQLTEISFEMDISKAKSITVTIDNLLKNTTQHDNSTREAFNYCKQIYSFVSIELTAGLKALKAKNYETAFVVADTAFQGASICQLGLTKHMIGFSTFTRENTYFMHLASISASFLFPHN